MNFKNKTLKNKKKEIALLFTLISNRAQHQRNPLNHEINSYFFLIYEVTHENWPKRTIMTLVITSAFSSWCETFVPSVYFSFLFTSLFSKFENLSWLKLRFFIYQYFIDTFFSGIPNFSAELSINILDSSTDYIFSHKKVRICSLYRVLIRNSSQFLLFSFVDFSSLVLSLPYFNSLAFSWYTNIIIHVYCHF